MRMYVTKYQKQKRVFKQPLAFSFGEKFQKFFIQKIEKKNFFQKIEKKFSRYLATWGV